MTVQTTNGPSGFNADELKMGFWLEAWTRSQFPQTLKPLNMNHYCAQASFNRFFWGSTTYRIPDVVGVLDVCYHQVGRLDVEEQESLLLLVDVGQSSGIRAISRQRRHPFPVMVVEDNLETDKVDLELCKPKTYCIHVYQYGAPQPALKKLWACYIILKWSHFKVVFCGFS